jgi:hypothetical protein
MNKSKEGMTCISRGTLDCYNGEITRPSLYSSKLLTKKFVHLRWWACIRSLPSAPLRLVFRGILVSTIVPVVPPFETATSRVVRTKAFEVLLTQEAIHQLRHGDGSVPRPRAHDDCRPC